MSDLQLSLIVIGGVIVSGVVTFNKWQEWRAKKSVDNAFSPLHEDVLMGTDGNAANERHEPFIPSAETDAAMHDDAMAMEPGPQEQDEAAHDAPLSFIQVTSKPSPLDPIVDCIIPLSLDLPLRGEKIAAAFHGMHFVGNKLVQVVGENEAGNWEAIAHGGVYHALQVGVQLATRNGPLSELEYSELVMRLNQMADELGAQPEVPDMMQVIADARRLHQLILEFDVQLSINVKAKGMPWMLSTMRPAFQRQGLELRADGRLIMPDGEGGILFTVLTNAKLPEDTSTLMTLLLPVALVAKERNGYTAMTAFAKSLATRLSGEIVDDSGALLTAQALNDVAAQVEDFYAFMEQSGMIAGSAPAKRLFS